MEGRRQRTPEDVGPALGPDDLNDEGSELGADPTWSGFADWLARRKKAIAAAISFPVSWVILKIGLDVDPEVATAISTGITTAIIERIRNRGT